MSETLCNFTVTPANIGEVRQKMLQLSADLGGKRLAACGSGAFAVSHWHVIMRSAGITPIAPDGNSFGYLLTNENERVVCAHQVSVGDRLELQMRAEGARSRGVVHCRGINDSISFGGGE